MEGDVTQKNNIRVELEHDVSKKYDDITELKREFDDLKGQFTSSKIDSQGEELLRGTIQEIWDRIAQIFNEK